MMGTYKKYGVAQISKACRTGSTDVQFLISVVVAVVFR